MNAPPLIMHDTADGTGGDVGVPAGHRREAGPAPIMTAADQFVEVASHIRDHVTVLANALEVIRLGGEVAVPLRMAARQIAALARLADSLYDPARCG